MKKFKFKGKKLCDYIVYTNDKNKHIAVFKDYENNIREVEISDLIKEALIMEKRKEKNQQNEFDRHIEHFQGMRQKNNEEKNKQRKDTIKLIKKI